MVRARLDVNPTGPGDRPSRKSKTLGLSSAGSLYAFSFLLSILFFYHTFVVAYSHEFTRRWITWKDLVGPCPVCSCGPERGLGHPRSLGTYTGT